VRRRLCDAQTECLSWFGERTVGVVVIQGLPGVSLLLLLLPVVAQGAQRRAPGLLHGRVVAGVVAPVLVAPRAAAALLHRRGALAGGMRRLRLRLRLGAVLQVLVQQRCVARVQQQRPREVHAAARNLGRDRQGQLGRRGARGGGGYAP